MLERNISRLRNKNNNHQLAGKRCKVYPVPFGVRLFEQDGDSPEDVDTVAGPDISVVCDRSKIDKRG